VELVEQRSECRGVERIERRQAEPAVAEARRPPDRARGHAAEE
jgi:hypothetical protein